MVFLNISKILLNNINVCCTIKMGPRMIIKIIKKCETKHKIKKKKIIMLKRGKLSCYLLSSGISWIAYKKDKIFCEKYIFISRIAQNGTGKREYNIICINYNHHYSNIFFKYFFYLFS